MSPESPLYPIWAAVQNDPYDAGESRYTVTQLLQPIQATVLAARHRAELVEIERAPENLPDHFWRLFGQIVHGILERSGAPNVLREKRLFAEIAGVKVSGQADSLYLAGEHLWDYKLTTVYTAIGSSAAARRAEWTMQLNMLARLAELNGHKVSRLTLVPMYRDWRPGEAARERRYPGEFDEIPVSLWPSVQTHAIMEARVNRLLIAEGDGDKELPACMPAETWETPDRWANKAPNKKRARKLYYSKAEAYADLKAGEQVEVRPGDRPRCTGGLRKRPYCPAAPWCGQLKRWQVNR